MNKYYNKNNNYSRRKQTTRIDDLNILLNIVAFFKKKQ
jgi:hypothetical protein